MKSYEFDGWVHKVNRQKWGVEVTVRGDADEVAVKFPQHILFFASNKNRDKVPDDLDVNDHVNIKFVPVLDEGISERTKRAYAINKMMIVELTILEKVSRGPSRAEENNPDDIPW